MPRIMVTGHLQFANTDALVYLFQQYRERFAGSETVFVHGNARGADTLSARVAGEIIPDITFDVHPPLWDQFGRGAGPIRNQQMVDTGPTLAIAFAWDGEFDRGTCDTMRRIESAGIPMIRVNANNSSWAIAWHDGSVTTNVTAS